MPTACEEASFWIGQKDREERKKTRNLENRVRIRTDFITKKSFQLVQNILFGAQSKTGTIITAFHFLCNLQMGPKS
jgi:hypothetical protein